MHLMLKKPESLNDTKTLKELIFKGADKNLKDKFGRTALDWFLEADQIRMQSYGMRVGSDTTQKKEVIGILGDQPCYIPCLHFKQPMQK